MRERVISSCSKCNNVTSLYYTGFYLLFDYYFFLSLFNIFVTNISGANGDQCGGDLLNSKRFMLDMLYSQKPCEEDEDEELEKDDGTPEILMSSEVHQHSESKQKAEPKLEGGTVRAFAERFGDLVKGLNSPALELLEEQRPPLPPLPPKKESEHIWDQLLETPRELRIGDMDFTDLVDEDDQNVLDSECLIGSGALAPPPAPPPPPCPFGMFPPPLPPGLGARPAPPPPLLSQSERPLYQKKKKTIRLFWSEVRPEEWRFMGSRRGNLSLWSKLEPVRLDTSKLELLFESKSKEMNVTKVLS